MKYFTTGAAGFLATRWRVNCARRGAKSMLQCARLKKPGEFPPGATYTRWLLQNLKAHGIIQKAKRIAISQETRYAKPGQQAYPSYFIGIHRSDRLRRHCGAINRETN